MKKAGRMISAVVMAVSIAFLAAPFSRADEKDASTRLDYLDYGASLKEKLVYEGKMDFVIQNRAPEPSYKKQALPRYRDSNQSYGGFAYPEFRSIPSAAADIGAALVTSFVIHEAGHAVVADYVGAEGLNMSFFKRENNKFFLGETTVTKIDHNSMLPFAMGGEFAADLTFEYALQSYREKPTVYNEALLFFSGMDFVRYSAYAFYISNPDPYYDPVAVSEETGLSKDVIFSIALAKTMINAYRVYSGQDRVVPYFTVDKEAAFLNFRTTF